MSGITVLLETPYFNVTSDNGYFVINERAKENGVVILAQREPHGEYLICEINRRAIGLKTWEFPRGSIDEGESAAEAALRELSEETGFQVANAKVIGRCHSNTSLLSSHVAIAQVTVTEGPKGTTDGEVTGMKWVSKKELLNMIAIGDITDGHTLSAVAIQQALDML